MASVVLQIPSKCYLAYKLHNEPYEISLGLFMNMQHVLEFLNRPLPFPEILEREIDFAALMQLNFSEMLRPPVRGRGRRRAARSRCNPAQTSSKSPNPAHPAERHETRDQDTFNECGSLTYGQATMFAMHGEDLILTDVTWIFGELRVGAEARVKGMRTQSGIRCTSVIMS